jgi:hypothetical protein
LIADRAFPDSTAVAHPYERALPVEELAIDGLKPLVDERTEFIELFADRPARGCEAVLRQDGRALLEGLLIDEVILEAAVSMSTQIDGAVITLFDVSVSIPL